MKHILHLITNTVEPTLQATLQSQSKTTDHRITIVTTWNPAEIIVSSDTPIFSLADAEDPEFNSLKPMNTSRLIGYEGLMDLIFEAETIVAW
ncbi:MAG TPA: hypothetical protein EYN18_09325 [Nitrospirales bacterium]|nr:hypothetical protein [Nitrospirales bacterium]HIA13701.1 hypothetical protein [Nitrospirales bacterium]HIB54523.1 hypothetical protein [Nitrospirales bacterium]HIO22573.1 hypothetical protein [Nitrospirales bacterium]